MLNNEQYDIAITGQFDELFKKRIPPHISFISWQFLKSLAFYESELQPYVDGGLFRTPSRLYYEYDGVDPYNAEDSIATMIRILIDWWYRLYAIQESSRMVFVLLAYKLRMYNVEDIVQITTDVSKLSNYFSPGLIYDIKRIVDMEGMM